MNTNRERVIHFHWPHKSQLRDGSAELSPAGPASSTSCSLRCSHDPHLAAQRSTPTTATSSRAPSRRTSNSHQGDRRGALLRPSSDLADKLARSATSGTATCASYAARRESSLGWAASRSSVGHIRCVGRVRAQAQERQLRRKGGTPVQCAPQVKPGPRAGSGREPHAPPLVCTFGPQAPSDTIHL